jgi:hypothetical protein
MTAAGGGIGYGTEKDEVRQGAAGSLSFYLWKMLGL